jgi:hypothetical protein
VAARLRQRRQRRLSSGDAGVGLGPAGLGEHVRRGDGGELGVAVDPPGRQRGEQRAERLVLAVEQQVDPVAAEQLARQLPVAAVRRVADRLDRVAVLGVPPGREQVQLEDGLGRLALQLEAE